MSRRAPSSNVLRALLVRSGNQCAFPGCTHPICNEDGEYVAELTHIEAASPGGSRHNPDQSDDERRGYGNLMLLCHRHHGETHDDVKYAVADLQCMKWKHERAQAENPARPDESLVAKLRAESERYWRAAEDAQRSTTVPEDVLVRISLEQSFEDALEEVRHVVASIDDAHEAMEVADGRLWEDVLTLLSDRGHDVQALRDLPYCEIPVGDHNDIWYIYGLPNRLIRLRLLLDFMEVRYMEAHLLREPDDLRVRAKLEACREALEGTVAEACRVE